MFADLSLDAIGHPNENDYTAPEYDAQLQAELDRPGIFSYDKQYPPRAPEGHLISPLSILQYPPEVEMMIPKCRLFQLIGVRWPGLCMGK